MLRRLFKFAIRPAAWRCGLGNALVLLELELSEILLFSTAKRLPEHLFCDSEAGAAPSELGKARKEAAGAVKVLRKILKDARADLSVDESLCNLMDNAIDLVEQELNKLLPPPGAPPKAKLPFDDDEGDGPVETDLDSDDGMAQPGGERGL